MKVIRWLCGISTAVDIQQAEVLAVQAARQRGIEFEPPYLVSSRLTGYLVVSRANVLGGNRTVTVDCRSGQVGEFSEPMNR
jgi:hypothetical protein